METRHAAEKETHAEGRAREENVRAEGDRSGTSRDEVFGQPYSSTVDVPQRSGEAACVERAGTPQRSRAVGSTVIVCAGSPGTVVEKGERRQDAAPANARNVLPLGARPTLPDSEGSAGRHSVQRPAEDRGGTPLVGDASLPLACSAKPIRAGADLDVCPVAESGLGIKSREPKPAERGGITPTLETDADPDGPALIVVEFFDDITGQTVGYDELRRAMLGTDG